MAFIPTPTAKKSGHSRSSNYTTEEDEALIMACESVSLDAVKGNEQSSSTYWKRIYDHYHRNKRSTSPRIDIKEWIDLKGDHLLCCIVGLYCNTTRSG
ncbi:hypothetical protein C2845_PM01G44860 [Panicum miliaceum]|uniref:Uncharacterized protein n=1 Tax=Panicum miliaceum TaxID=4540 RepID=A0A3L6TFP7_PANMI|nr:hypothetical protein C2845_PM01G44860 [Panicum miliaceum]